jgi:APA family basic amino acid/polyamine antiporter
MNLLMAVKIALLVMLIAAPFLLDVQPVQRAATPSPADSPIAAFFMCFIPIFFTYGGYQQTINFGSDIPNASRNLPKAIMMGMGLVTVVYLAVNLAYYQVLGLSGMQSSTTLASDIMGMLFGETAHHVVSVIMFFSVMAFVNVSVMSNPRVYLAMSEDRVLPPAFRKVNSKTQVPVTGVIVFCLFILITLFFLDSFQRILEFVMFFDSVSLITAAATIFILRKQAAAGTSDGIYKMRAYPWIPVLFILVYGTVMASVFVANAKLFYAGMLLFALGYPLYTLIIRANKKAAT